MRYDKKPEGIRTIKTARSEEEMNNAVKVGYRPLVKMVDPHPMIYQWSAIYQHPETGMCQIVNDARLGIELQSKGYNRLFINTSYPYSFSPFAAYLLPKDLTVGETVWLEDLIEDFIDGIHHSVWRLDATTAIWNGADFEIQYDPKKDVEHYIG